MYFSVSDADVWIEPSRLQAFEYKPVSLRCVGFDGLTDVNILRWSKTGKETCDGSKWGSFHETTCNITSPYKEDSGDYWCEAGGKKSVYVNVIITGMLTLTYSFYTMFVRRTKKVQ